MIVYELSFKFNFKKYIGIILVKPQIWIKIGFCKIPCLKGEIGVKCFRTAPARAHITHYRIYKIEILYEDPLKKTYFGVS